MPTSNSRLGRHPDNLPHRVNHKAIHRYGHLATAGRGKLQLDDPLHQHLSWFNIQNRHPNAPAITIRHLLTHTSGLPREASPFPYRTDGYFPSREQSGSPAPSKPSWPPKASGNTPTLRSRWLAKSLLPFRTRTMPTMSGNTSSSRCGYGQHHVARPTPATRNSPLDMAGAA